MDKRFHFGTLVPLRVGASIPLVGVNNLQHFADRLDSETQAMLVDEFPQDFKRRSSSAWAKNALANFNISLARYMDAPGLPSSQFMTAQR